MARKRGVKFSDKKHSIKGIISIVIGLVSLVALIVLFYLSAKTKGGGSINLGLVGVIILILSILAITLSYQGYKERDIHHYVPVIGLILNGLLFLVLFILYIVGTYK